MSTIFALLAVIANVAVIGATVLALGGRLAPGSIGRIRDAVWDTVGDAALPLAFIVALTCTLGSLYFSEIAHFDPCKLCWFQRIAMYPLPVILAIAWWRRDLDVWRYVVPLAAIGAAISIYHYQLERFPNQASPTCTLETPCTLVWIWRFHYISIPFMALSGFTLIITLLLLARRTAAADTEE